MESHKLSIRRILIDLLSIKDQLKMLFNNNTEYATLINFLTEKDYYDNIPLPSLKEIEFKTGLKTNKLRNKLVSKEQMERDIFEFIEICYNRKRKHSALNYKTIEEFWKQKNNFKNVA
jgi:transposase InsO family protein